jgi:hypothetical protein
MVAFIYWFIQLLLAKQDYTTRLYLHTCIPVTNGSWTVQLPVTNNSKEFI